MAIYRSLLIGIYLVFFGSRKLNLCRMKCTYLILKCWIEAGRLVDCESSTASEASLAGHWAISRDV